MFTYGYIREATMAHLDIDETEAQAMGLLSRFHIFANEAMQAICASKPMYQYIDVTVVKKFDPLVTDGSFLRPATVAELNWDVDTQGPRPFEFVSEEITKDYYHKQNIYEVLEHLKMTDTFIAFANKQAYKVYIEEPSIEELLDAEAFGCKPRTKLVKKDAEINNDFSYIGRNEIKFYKPGKYLIPARYMWFRFDSGIGDDVEINIPSDIILCIPLYIASVCLEIDNLQKSQILKSQFETALARCTSGDFMPLNKMDKSW